VWDAEINVIRATGTTTKALRKYLSNLTGKHGTKGVQKTVTLGTAHVLWKVLM
jgi:hypothetical protein